MSATPRDEKDAAACRDAASYKHTRQMIRGGNIITPGSPYKLQIGCDAYKPGIPSRNQTIRPVSGVRTKVSKACNGCCSRCAHFRRQDGGACASGVIRPPWKIRFKNKKTKKQKKCCCDAGAWSVICALCADSCRGASLCKGPRGIQLIMPSPQLCILLVDPKKTVNMYGTYLHQVHHHTTKQTILVLYSTFCFSLTV